MRAKRHVLIFQNRIAAFPHGNYILSHRMFSFSRDGNRDVLSRIQIKRRNLLAILGAAGEGCGVILLTFKKRRRHFHRHDHRGNGWRAAVLSCKFFDDGARRLQATQPLLVPVLRSRRIRNRQHRLGAVLLGIKVRIHPVNALPARQIGARDPARKTRKSLARHDDDFVFNIDTLIGVHVFRFHDPAVTGINQRAGDRCRHRVRQKVVAKVEFLAVDLG